MALWANVTTNCIPCMHSTNDGVFSVLERWRSLGGSASASQPMTSRLLSPFLLLAAADLLFFFCGATSPGAAHGAALVASVSFLPVLPPLPSLWLALSPFFPSASMAPPLSSPCTLEPVGVTRIAWVVQPLPTDAQAKSAWASLSEAAPNPELNHGRRRQEQRHARPCVAPRRHRTGG